jgi:hypothetical protein
LSLGDVSIKSNTYNLGRYIKQRSEEDEFMSGDEAKLQCEGAHKEKETEGTSEVQVLLSDREEKISSSPMLSLDTQVYFYDLHSH